MSKHIGSWEGGRVVENRKGQSVFLIRKRIGGVSYSVSTGATKLKAALEQLARFQANPAAYTPSGKPKGDALTIERHLEDYFDWCAKKGNSPNWRYQKRRYLKWWSKQFPGDVRMLTREKVLAPLGSSTVPHNRLASLKAFCSWLRETQGLLSRAEDVTMDIAITAPKPAQWTAPRAISREVYKLTLEKLEQPWRDIVIVLGGTGMHTSECLRLARGQGTIVGATLTIFHKAGSQHRMEVDDQTAEAVVRMQKRGGFSVSRLQKAVREAWKAAKVERWAPGGLRHSVATWLIGEGASIESVASYLNHDVATLKRYYSIAVIPRPAGARI